MAKFKYTARNADGKSVTGVLTAPSLTDANARLRRMNLTPLNLKEQEGTAQSWWARMNEPKPRLKGDDLAVFTRQLATMIGAGIALMEALEILAEQTDDKGFQKVLRTVVDDVRGGTDFSEALGKHTKVFSNIYVSMVRAAEASGQLDAILERLAQYMEASVELKREVKSAMTYPCISLVMVFGIATFLMLVIVPQFETMFDDILGGKPLPKATQVIVAISKFMKTNLLPIVIGLVVGIILLSTYVKKSPRGAWQWDWLKLKLPIFGSLMQKICLARFSQTFATLLKSGVPIMGALEIVEKTVGNRLIEDDVAAARDAVRKGEQLSKPLEKSTVIPMMVTRMIAVGERSGALEALLEKIAQFYDQQAKAMIKSLTSLIEPLMIGMMGLIVGGIVIAIFLPIFKAPTLI